MAEGVVRRMGGVLVAAWLAALAPARAEGPQAVLELFTSQGCSSCPPADKLLGELASDPSVIALSFPVDLWDYLGWKDTLADPLYTARQRAYAQARGDRDVYTPQLVINGRAQVVGSDRGKIEQAIKTVRFTDDTAPVRLVVEASHLKVAIGQGKAMTGEVWVCAVARHVPVAIGRGENSAREIVYHNVVRRWLKVGDWNGRPGNWDVPLENISGENIDAAVVYVQSGSRERPGPMLGAAFAALK